MTTKRLVKTYGYVWTSIEFAILQSIITNLRRIMELEFCLIDSS